MGDVRPLRAISLEDDRRSRAEALAREGSPAAALALMTAAAEDAEPDDPHSAAVVLAEASWYARLAHGPERALELARHAKRLSVGGDARVELVVSARLGDALQSNGRYAEAQT